MAKRIIILEKMGEGKTSYRVAFWASVPVARKSFYVNAEKVSAWKGASVAENTALQDGSIVESVEKISTEGQKTKGQLKAILEARWTALQSEIDARNPWDFYGTTFDGAVWTEAGVI